MLLGLKRSMVRYNIYQDEIIVKILLTYTTKITPLREHRVILRHHVTHKIYKGIEDTGPFV